MERVFNFSAGPAALPTEVLEIAQMDLLDFQGKGLSVMEMSHRSEEFLEIIEQAEDDLRAILGIDTNYQVLLLQGGATLQFAMIPLNMSESGEVVDYINTGAWSSKAIEEARKHAEVHVAASGENNGFTSVPARSSWNLNRNAKYVHITTNETIGGVQFHEIPDVGDIPLIADVSSDFLSRPMEVNRFGLLYSGAQKNLGPAGLTIVIVREDLMGKARAGTATMLNYEAHVRANSMLNTPPTFSIYVAGLVLGWIKKKGGLIGMAIENKAKSDLLYSAIDASDFYNCPVAKPSRSTMNVPFTLGEPTQEANFLRGAKEEGLVNLKGHRSVGGMRASLYNAVQMPAVKALTDYMKRFERAL